MTIRPLSWLCGILAAASLLCAAEAVPAQQHPQPPVRQQLGTDVTIMRSNVRRVILDVVVTGKNGTHVVGLTKDDFAIKEDGTAQQLKSFDVHDFNAPPSFLPPSLPPLGPNAFLNLPKEPERGPLYVLLYDLVNIEMVDQPPARRQLLKFILNKPAGTRFAIVVLSDGMHLVQGFTEDKSELLAALDSRTSRPHVPMIFLYGRNYGTGDGAVSASQFTELAHYLEGFSGRKNVLWISGKFPLSLFANLDNDVMGDGDYTDKVKDVVDTLARDQISIYPVDTQGALVTEEYGPPGSSSSEVGATSDSRGAAIGTPAAGGGPTAPAQASHASMGQGSSQTASKYMAEEALAQATGGHAFYSTNDLTAALEKATDNGANYYTLSYTPTNGDYNGKLRSIKVELAKKGYTLAYRRSYFGVDHPARPQPTEKPVMELAGASGSIPQDDPLSTEMRHGAPLAYDLIFRAQLQATGTPALATPEQMSRLIEDPGALRSHKRNKPVKAPKPVLIQSYTIDYRLLTDQRSKSSPGTSTPPPKFEFVAAAFDSEGNMLSGVLQNAQRDESPTKAQTGESGLVRVRQQFDVPANAAWIRVAVRDLMTNRTGALEVRLPLAMESTAHAESTKIP